MNPLAARSFTTDTNIGCIPKNLTNMLLSNYHLKFDIQAIFKDGYLNNLLMIVLSNYI